MQVKYAVKIIKNPKFVAKLIEFRTKIIASIQKVII